jgi:hypothetical protein
MSHDRKDYHTPRPDEIALCAYLIWEKEGRPPGREREFWLQAEIQLAACRAHEHWTSPEAAAKPPGTPT